MVRRWSSAIFHEPQPDGRLRDPCPLPHLKPQGVADRGLCRATIRRVLRRDHVTKMTNRLVDSLNSFFFGGSNHPSVAAVDSLDDLPLIQGLALQRIIAAVKRLGPSPLADDSGACKALRVAASGYFEPGVSVGDVVSMDFTRLSLPSVGTAGVDLLAALEEPVRYLVSEFEDRMLQHDLTWTAIIVIVHIRNPIMIPHRTIATSTSNSFSFFMIGEFCRFAFDVEGVLGLSLFLRRTRLWTGPPLKGNV